ncbi:hypothetical protein HET73_06670 [Wolbachia endosymbiont of Atemnus politus]|nr:hypothetical protein [Wolbachia endosymbiont of Atemnus politus]NSX83400.1 hypothetical protein [Wolbachia endosymbiont of Atemnus politus]
MEACMLNSNETVSLIVDQNIAAGNVYGSIPSKDKRRYVTLDDEETWKKFFVDQNSPSTNITNKVTVKPHVHKNSDGMYRYTAEETKYYGREIVGKAAKQIEEEIFKNIDAKLIKLRETKNIDNSVKPVIRVVLNDYTKEVNMYSILSGNMCKKYDVKTVTLLLPDQKTRGVRCQIDKDGVRIYEVANGSYQTTLKWYVEGKECNIKINIHDNGSVELVEGNGITEEQLLAHKEVKVGRQYEAKSLHEALASQLPQTQLQQSSEEVNFLEQLSTNVEDLSGASQKHQAPAAQMSK